MSLIADERERPSDSPYVEWVSDGRTASSGSTIRPAESQCHLVVARHHGGVQLIYVGPLTTSGVVVFAEGAELLWIQLKLGTFMPHLPVRDFVNVETVLPQAASQKFWLKGSAWQYPDYANADTFIDRLVRQEVLAHDPLVTAALAGQAPPLPARTLRHRFLRATGLTQSHIRQVLRAKRAAALLRQGTTILDTVHAAGYFDQPHLTRSLKQWIGYTPAQLYRPSPPPCRSVQDVLPVPGYPTHVLVDSP
jgi:AraC-like DNA-binding protein